MRSERELVESSRVKGGVWLEGSGDTERRFREQPLYLLKDSNEGSTIECNGLKGVMGMILGLLVMVDLEVTGEHGQLSSETLRPLEFSPYMVARRVTEPIRIFPKVTTSKSAVSAAPTDRQTFGDLWIPWVEINVSDGRFG